MASCVDSVMATAAVVVVPATWAEAVPARQSAAARVKVAVLKMCFMVLVLLCCAAP